MRQGSEAEDSAAEYLMGLGFTLVTRRHKARGGELDIVALDGEDLVFVEVRSRRAGMPEASISQVKVSRLFAAAQDYLRQANQVGRPFRFDIITFSAEGLRHHRGAFADYADLDA